MLNKRLSTILLASVIFFSSCGGSDTKSSSEQSSSDSNQSPTAPAGSDESDKASINFTIKGGGLDGTYNASCKSGCCSWGIAGENVFGNQYSETGKGAKELSSVQLIVDDVKQGSKSTKEFTVTVSFGELFSEEGKSFNINTRKGRSEGSGTLDLQYSGNTATVTIKGKSKEGPEIDLKLQCNNVLSPTNLVQ